MTLQQLLLILKKSVSVAQALSKYVVAIDGVSGLMGGGWGMGMMPDGEEGNLEGDEVGGMLCSDS